MNCSTPECERHLPPTMKKPSKPIPNPGDGIAVSEGYLDKVGVAKRLGVKPKTVAEWANQGKLPAYRVGTYLRFKWAEVEEHLAATSRVGHGELECSRKDAKAQSF